MQTPPQTITVTLKDPIALPSGETLTWVALKKSTAGIIALARAAIAKDARFGPAMVDDTVAGGVFTIPRLVADSNVQGDLPPIWTMQASEDDLEALLKTYAALREGYGSVAELEAAKKAEAEGVTPAAKAQAAFPGGQGDPET